MRQKKKIPTNYLLFSIFNILLLFNACNTGNRAVTSVEDLQCCNLTNPEGIDHPLLSWKIRSSRQGVAQAAWEIEIASRQELLEKGEADIWKSGKQPSDQQFGIQPTAEFKEGRSYCWRVRIWENNDEATPWSKPAGFSIGLLNESAWKAKWITYADPDQHALPYFRKSFSTEKGKKISKALAYFCGLGAGDRKSVV